VAPWGHARDQEGLMQVYFVMKGVRGYHSVMDRQEYVNHPRRDEIEHRLKVIKFFDKHGLVATREAFGVCRATVYAWKKRLKEAGGDLVALASQSRAPKRKRPREVSKEVVQFILSYRTQRPGVGKVTIKSALDEFCAAKGLRTVSESTVGRVIHDLREQGKLPIRTKFSMNARTGRLVERPLKPYRLKPRRKDYRPKKPGDLVQLDAVCVFEDGVKRYIISCIDLVTRFAFAWCYQRLTSLAAKDLLNKFLSVAPFDITHVQTDNGSEFEDHFRRAAEELGLVHFYNYPHHPQSNGHVERFQRTLRDQFLKWCEEDAADTTSFNRQLAQWLLWYNTQKPHTSLGRLPPLRYLMDTFITNPNQSNMCWTSTGSCPPESHLLHSLAAPLALHVSASR